MSKTEGGVTVYGATDRTSMGDKKPIVTEIEIFDLYIVRPDGSRELLASGVAPGESVPALCDGLDSGEFIHLDFWSGTYVGKLEFSDEN